VEEWEIKHKHILALAFMGDAVAKLVATEQLLTFGDTKPELLHKQATSIVRAKSQAYNYTVVSPSFSEAEKEIAQRAYNAKQKTTAKNCTLAEYRCATALEAVIGYNWLLGNKDRARELVGI